MADNIDRIAGVDLEQSFAEAEGAAAAATSDLIISEIVEGSSLNKAIELYNATDAEIDLALAGYQILIYFNGSTSPGTTIDLTGTIAPGETFVLADDGAVLGITPDQTSAASFFNGNDAIVLTRGGVVVDSFGQVGVDPGSKWQGGGQDDTLRRVTAPDSDPTDAFDAGAQWTIAPQDDFSDLGQYAGAEPQIVINEFSFSTTGTDVEYVEIFSAPNTDLSGLALIAIEGDATAGAGAIDAVISLNGEATDASGFYLASVAANTFENGTISLLLVEGFSGAVGDDIDTDDDGLADATPWTSIVDDVAVSDGDAGDATYAAAVLDQGFDDAVLDNPFAPGGASRLPDGQDTDSAADWVRNDFDLAGIPGFVGTLQSGEAVNTPGAPNGTVAPGPAGTVVINEIHADPASDIAGDANGDGLRDATEDEFVEIVNSGTETVDLGGAQLSDGVAVRHVFTDGTTLAPGAAIVVFGGGAPTGEFGGAQVLMASSGALGLNNGGDSVTLTSGDGATVLASASYGGEGGDNQSLTRDPELTGDFVKHTTVASALYSPGTAADGAPFASGEDDVTLISAVQGAGRETPLAGQIVTIEAIVVGDYQDGDGVYGNLNGFYLQEEDADADGDPMTSEGLFVFDGSNAAVDVSIGDKVRVTGVAGEFFGETQISDVTRVEVVSSGNALPTAAEIVFPVATLVDGVADLEMYEGMRVAIPQEMTVGDVFNLGRFGEIDLNALGRVATYTQFNEPDVAGFEAYYAEAARNAIVLDDGESGQNTSVLPLEIAGEPGRIDGEFDAEDDLNSGDTISGLTGVLGFGFGQYRVQPTDVVEFTDSNPREPEAPDVGGSLTVATFNVLNYFTTLDDGVATSGPNGDEPRGADNEEEFERQTEKLTAALSEIDADVLGLIEIENEYGDQNGDGEFAIATLVAELNDATGRSYAFVDPGVDYLGGDAIAVGLIYDTATVRLSDDTSVAFLTDADLAGLGLDFGNPVFDGPGTSRAPLAASFEELSSGEVFTVAVNHFKSKGSISPFGDNEGTGDGAGNNNEARLQAAIALDAWLDTDPTGSGDPDVMITGDLNAYAMEDPIRYLIDQGYVNLSAAFTEAADLDYSYGFPLSDETPQVQGFGTLDYALASASLFEQVTGAEHWHINADEASALDYDTTFGPDDQDADLYAPDPFRSSDHDPILVGLDLKTPKPVLAGGPGFDRLIGTDAAEIIVGGGGPIDQVRGNGGADEFVLVDLERRDTLRIADYTPGEDALDLNGGVIESTRSLGSNFLITMEGGDRVVLAGVDGLEEITFVDHFAMA